MNINYGCTGGVNTGYINVFATGGSGNYTYHIGTTPPPGWNGVESVGGLSNNTYYVGAYDNAYGEGSAVVTTRSISCTAAPTTPPTPAPVTPPPTTPPTPAPVVPVYYYNASRCSDNVTFIVYGGTNYYTIGTVVVSNTSANCYTINYEVGVTSPDDTVGASVADCNDFACS